MEVPAGIETRFELALEAIDAGVTDWDVALGRMSLSPRMERLLGLDAGAFDGDPTTFERMVAPDDLARVAADFETAKARGEERLICRYRVRRADDEERWLESSSRLVFGPEGALVRVVSAHLDVTEQRLDEARRQWTAEEQSHRLKNTLTLVQTMARQSFRSEATLRVFEHRLQALAAAHAVLVERRWTSAAVATLVEAATAPHLSDPSRLRASGPPVALDPRAAVALSLALHELATNALKHGALSGSTGRVEVDWTLDQGRMHLIWREQGGPRVAAAPSRGFGRRLLEQGLATDLGGRISLDFRDEGVVCQIDARVADGG